MGKIKLNPKITPFLWFNNNAEEAINFYASVFKNTKIGNINRYGEGTPLPKGTLFTGSIEIEGQLFSVMNAGPHYHFTPAISFVINCQDQAEIDYYWSKLSADPREEQCGWLKDQFGLSWQVVPHNISELLFNSDPAKAGRITQALMKMKKLIIADLIDA